MWSSSSTTVRPPSPKTRVASTSPHKPNTFNNFYDLTKSSPDISPLTSPMTNHCQIENSAAAPRSISRAVGLFPVILNRRQPVLNSSECDFSKSKGSNSESRARRSTAGRALKLTLLPRYYRAGPSETSGEPRRGARYKVFRVIIFFPPI
jgi:hypothetical protein